MAQSRTVDKSLSFDVAPVKPAIPPTPNGQGMVMFRAPSGGPVTKDPGRIKYPNISLKNLLNGGNQREEPGTVQEGRYVRRGNAEQQSLKKASGSRR